MTKNPRRILIVTSSTPRYTTAGYRTGLWLGELTHFYDVVTDAGHDVVIASIDGGMVPLDPESLSTLMLKSGGTGDRYADPAFMSLLDATVSIADVSADDIDAIYLTGGHGTMFDFPTSEALASLVAELDAQGKVVAAVCHGPAGLLGARRADGTPVIKGRKVTGFSWPEEKLAKRQDAVPFRLDEELKALGAKYTKALVPFKDNVVRDKNLITGQNPQSAASVAKAVVKRLK
ncbi:type 1 glutamine amidotransferase domain-containing protein [Arsenicicoccus sp. oral taxon 190]|uniref:type 1 glutamine amidotransferase domain-containing protein n=1 Tax=Arsenicicoccus sp. oral taxon 190 TaxID=1658671 RepID=UPI00067A40B5|nr:type 1 glutamine amidotransferase domain-containing protein [Arsenicicoccus sp. oral taxon 190]AKT51859.1 thiamine biosynthesis protein ThiJ [Arsenicicoccus sp. oral taxon 190]